METTAPLSPDLELRLSTRGDGSLHLSAVHDGACAGSETIIPPDGQRADMAPFTAIRRVLLTVASSSQTGERYIDLPSGSRLHVFENCLLLRAPDLLEERVWKATTFLECPGVTTFDLLFTLDQSAMVVHHTPPAESVSKA